MLPDMKKPARTELPVHRSFNPEAIGHGAAIFGFNSKRRMSEVSVPTLVGGLASAQGAPLGSTEFDTLTVALRMFQTRGASADGWVTCSMRELVTRIYGYTGGRTYELVGQALRNLFDVSVTLPSFDAESGEFTSDAISMTRLIATVVLKTGTGEFDAKSDDFWSKIGSLRSGDNPTVKIRFENWLAAAVRAQEGRELDYDVQRALRGAAKTCWVLLEASRFVPSADQEDVEEWSAVLDRSVYAAFGLNATRLTDSRAQLEAKLDRICELDPTYLGHEFEPYEKDRRRRVLVVRRATGQRRQRILRAALLAQAGLGNRPQQLRLAADGGGGGPP
jgi:hypothetical protein